MIISSCMKVKVFAIRDTENLAQAARLLVRHHIGLLPVINKDEKLVGIVGLRDLLALALPSFVQLVDDLDFVHDFGAFEHQVPNPEILGAPVTKYMRPAISVVADCGLLRAYSLMLQHKVHDLPVVSESGKLVGIASRVDIGTAILSSWDNSS